MDSNIYIFNLIACIYQKLLAFQPIEPAINVDPHFEYLLVEQTRRLTDAILSDPNRPISGVMDAVTKACKSEKESYLFYRTLLTQLDARVNMNRLIRKFNFIRPIYYDEDKTFQQMNDNRNETGVLILPKVSSPPVTFGVPGRDGMESKTGTDSNVWCDDINNRLHHVICISQNELKGFTPRNALLDIFEDTKERISIGLSPGCSLQAEELMDIRCYPENNWLYFEVAKYKDPDYLTKRFCESLDTAKKNQVDILIGAEMLGSQALADNRGLYFNSADDACPKLIVTPSFWNDRTNAVSVYLNTGELVGRQFKQYPFYWKDKDGNKYQERLDNSPKEVLLLHIPNLGRMAIPICMDYLRPEYQDLLVKTLKVNWLLCPSYSAGTIPFADINSAMRSFGARSIWFDSCSALQTHQTHQTHRNRPPIIGLVSTPIRDTVHIGTGAALIRPKCRGICHEGCVFAVKIQLKSTEKAPCNSVKIAHLK